MVKVALFDETLEIPKGVKVKIEGNNQVVIEGPNGGPINKDFSHARGVNIELKGKKLRFTSHFPKNKTLSLIKTIINIINNLIIGVQTNYKYTSKICYSHFPCTVEVKEKTKEIHVVNFLGERAPRISKYPQNVKVEVSGDDVYFIGPDKEALGLTAANVKRSCRIRKKDPRVFQDGVYLYKKQIGEEIIWEIK